jgi:hypothetical protein
MKKSLASLAAVVLTASVACAQAPFSDVPRDHWAYDSVNTLAQRGLVIGYPDGTFGGKRAMTRYEFAVVIARMLPQLEQYIQSEVAKATANIKPTPSTNVELPADLARKGDLAGFAKSADVEAIRRLVNEFGPELKLLRADVDGLKKDLAALDSRVTALEEEVGRVKVNGSIDVVSRGTSLSRSTWRDGLNVLDKNGNYMFSGDNILEANQMQYLLALGITGKVTDKITANAVIDVNNYFANVSAPRADFPYGNLGGGSRNADFGVYKAYIAAPIMGVNTEIGQFGVQFTPYTLKLQDYDYYTKIAQTDNGDYIATGIKGSTTLGPISLTGYAATHAQQKSATGFPVLVTANFAPRAANPLKQPSQLLFPYIPAASVELYQSAGLHAAFGNPDKFAIGATYIEGAIEKGVNYWDGASLVPVRRAQIYGANAKLALGKSIAITGEWAASDLSSEDDWTDAQSVYPSNKKNAVDARVTYTGKLFSLAGGYKQIDPFFGAPGAWGSIGSWYNPTNIKGPVVCGSLNLGKALSLTGGWEGYESVVYGNGSIASALDSSDATKIDRITAGLKWNVNKKNALGLKWENVTYKDIANSAISYGDDPKEDYYDIGWDTQLADNASLRLLYQIIDYKKSFYTGGQDATGNVAVAQFSVKF